MTKFITKVAFASVALAAVAVSAPAFAQAQLTNGPDGSQPNSLASKPHTKKMMRPLTVRPAGIVAPVAAVAPAAPAIVAAPIGAASTVVGLPFQILGGIFPAGSGTRPGGVTDVRYVGAGAKQAESDEGWTVPVPVDRSGPIYVVANGDPNVSPLSFIGYPIRAFGTIAQTPFKILGF